MGSILLRDITLDGKSSDIFISGGRITSIGPAGSCIGWDIAGDVEQMDCSGKVAIPGFVNMHTHAAMTLMRGIGEDMKFSRWLESIWKVEEKIDEEFVCWGAKVACLEMIRTGTATFNDQYWHFNQTLKAALEMGIRPSLGYDIMDKGDAEAAARQKDECVRAWEEAKVWTGRGAIYTLAFHAIYSVSEEMILWIADFARKNGLRLHIHLSETRQEVENCRKEHGGLTPVEYLSELGVLGPNLLAAHTLWLTEHDIELLAAAGVHCIHNINSNTKIASGYRFLYNELRDAGVNVCIGTDGCASSNNLDMLEAMKTSAIFQKAWRDDPAALPLDELMNMATVNGAKALGIDAGRLEVGAVADLSIVETDNSFFLSDAPFLANLVYSAHSDCIDSLIASGKFVMRHREIAHEKEILHQARKVLTKIK